jgi:GTP cyclohydrolase II
MATAARSAGNLILVNRAGLPTRYGSFRIVSFAGGGQEGEHVALVKGRVTGETDVLVRVHSECLTGDVFGSRRCDCGEQLDAALRRIGRATKGVLLYLAQEGRGIGISNKVAAYHLQDHGLDTVEANEALGFPADTRNYEFAAEMLRILGVRSVRLMTNNPQKISELQRHGIRVTKRIPLEVEANPANRQYLRTKREKLAHLID